MGGTITGIAKKLKEHNPNIIVVGVDPQGSILAEPDNLNDAHRLQPYEVEGIGYDFMPAVLNRSIVDEWYKSNDKESLVMMRKLIREEGLLCGGSCGAAVSCALKAAKKLKKGQRCVVILPDSVRNYMTKSLSDDWMIKHGYVDDNIIKPRAFQTWWAKQKVSDIAMTTPLTISSTVTCKEAISLLKGEGFDMVPVIGTEGDVIGVVTEGNMTSNILSGRANPDATVQEANVVYKNYSKFSMNDDLGDVALSLDHEPFALIITEQRCYKGSSKSNKDAALNTGKKHKMVERKLV